MEGVKDVQNESLYLPFFKGQCWFSKHRSLSDAKVNDIVCTDKNIVVNASDDNRSDGSDLITPSNYDKLEAAINCFGSSRRQSGRANFEELQSGHTFLFGVIGHMILYIGNYAMYLLLLKFFVANYVAYKLL